MNFWVLFALAPTPKAGVGAGPAGLKGGGGQELYKHRCVV